MYYTVTTITTVGYGDINAMNGIEKAICIFLMISGVFFFSYSSGSITNILQSQDQERAIINEKKLMLN
jgi:hypothetical protein